MDKLQVCGTILEVLIAALSVLSGLTRVDASYSPLALGRKDFLYRSFRHWGWMSFASILSWANCSRVVSLEPTTDAAFEDVEEHDMDCGVGSVQGGVCFLQHVYYCIFPTDMWLVCKLKGVLWWGHQSSDVCQHQSLHDLHYVWGQCYWPVVIQFSIDWRCRLGLKNIIEANFKTIVT